MSDKTRLTIRQPSVLGEPTHEYRTSGSDRETGAADVTVRLWSLTSRVHGGKIVGTDAWIEQDIEGECWLHGERPLYCDVVRSIPSRFADVEEIHRKRSLPIRHIQRDGESLYGFHFRDFSATNGRQYLDVRVADSADA